MNCNYKDENYKLEIKNKLLKMNIFTKNKNVNFPKLEIEINREKIIDNKFIYCKFSKSGTIVKNGFSIYEEKINRMIDKEIKDDCFVIELKKINIFWDMDGVIVFSENLHKKSWQEAINHFSKDNSHNINLDSFQGKKGILNSKTIVEKLNLEIEPSVVHKFKQNYFIENIVEIELNTESLNLIKAQEELNFGNYLVSSSTMSKHVINHFNIKMSGVVFPDEYTHSKPSPEIFITCMKKYNIDPKTIWVIEDSDIGLIASQEFKKAYNDINYKNYKNSNFENKIFDLNDFYLKIL
ncbi:MAG: HAD family phosphatase [Mycoplasma sp.]|nr:HAD family phosphatase [Mycoplasma sp.]